MRSIISDYGESIIYIVSGIAVTGIFAWMLYALSAV